MNLKNGQPYFVSNLETVKELQQNAKTVISLLQNGIKFTPTQPNIKRIERIMLEELKNNIIDFEYKSLTQREADILSNSKMMV